jgi:hypothetical protein
MSTVLDIARAIMAVCQPLTGTRATGEIVLQPTVDLVVEPNSYFYPVVNGSVRHDLLFKIARNPAREDKTWHLTANTPTPVQVLSNIGGARHNMPAGTRFVIEQPWREGLADRPVTLGGFTGGADPVENQDLALWNFVPYESFGAQQNLELFRSSIGGRFPAAMIVWTESEPADGMSTSGVVRPTKRGAGKISMSELFDIMLISNNASSEHERRGQGLRVLDEMTALLVDRMEVDGFNFSSPGGIHIRKRYRTPPNGEQFYKAFQVYNLTLSAQNTFVQLDTRVYSPLLSFKIDAPREDHPTAAAPTATDLPLVINNRVTNPQ